jgi:DNA polymerase III gamma/tau subunit
MATTDFGDLIQEHVCRTLQNAIEVWPVAMPFCLLVPEVSKTSAARILAKALQCEKDRRGITYCRRVLR